MLNRILDDSARIEYALAIAELWKFAPEMMKRKLERANVQQAFVYDTVKKFAQLTDEILSVGAYEDTAYESLKNQGYKVLGLDPCLGTGTLEEAISAKYKVVFSTSVLEHVQNDEEHVRCMCRSIQPSGYGIMTVDFQPGYVPGSSRLPTTDFRFYSKEDLVNRIIPVIREEKCELVDSPNWDCKTVDFEWEGIPYTFATMVFQKDANT